MDNVRNGFDQEVKKKLEEYLHPTQAETERQEETRQQSDPAGQENQQPYQEGNRTDKPGWITGRNTWRMGNT